MKGLNKAERMRRKTMDRGGEMKTYSPRKLARSVAKARMKKAGVSKVNKHFDSWRDYVLPGKRRAAK